MNSAVLGGRSAAQYVGLASRPPDYARVLNIDSASSEQIEWSRNMRSLTCIEGIQRNDAGGTIDELGVGEGITPYDGGDVVVAGNATYFIHIKDHPSYIMDQRTANVVNGYASITTWTRGGARTGMFNAAAYSPASSASAATTTGVGFGIGSVIRIRENGSGLVKTATVVAYTVYGETANYVTLSQDIKSGTILYIGPILDFVLAPAGFLMPAGILINETSNINVINTSTPERLLLEWGWFDSPQMPD
jgi:hypothetical protein